MLVIFNDTITNWIVQTPEFQKLWATARHYRIMILALVQSKFHELDQAPTQSMLLPEMEDDDEYAYVNDEDIEKTHSLSELTTKHREQLLKLIDEQQAEVHALVAHRRN